MQPLLISLPIQGQVFQENIKVQLVKEPENELRLKQKAHWTWDITVNDHDMNGDTEFDHKIKQNNSQWTSTALITENEKTEKQTK